MIGKGTSMLEAFRVEDDVLRQGIQGITDLIVKPVLVNMDFADVRTVMMERGMAHMGIGVGYGDNKTMDAAKQAIQSPLLETSIEGARGILYNVTGDPTMSLLEIEEAANLIRQAAHPEANIFFGADTDDSLEDEVRITVIATGFDSVRRPKPAMWRKRFGCRAATDDDFIPAVGLSARDRCWAALPIPATTWISRRSCAASATKRNFRQNLWQNRSTNCR